MDLPIPTVVKAVLKSLGPDQTEVEVHFNPTSLVYTIENSTPQQSGDPKRKQFAAQLTGKLTMDLQFDTTDTGEDVRSYTSDVALFMQASAGASQDKSSGANPQAPPVLSFEWGAYVFQGTMESFKETIDFFSADGIPLRALVSIGLARQDKVFDEGSDSGTDTSGSLVPTSAGDSATSAAAKGGNAGAARQLASANGLENPRFTNGVSLQVGGGIQFKAAAGFAASASIGGGIGLSAGAGLSLGAGASAGFGLSAGASAGASAGFGLSAGVSAGASAGFGLSAGASAGFGLSAGAGVGISAGVQVSGGITGGPVFGSKASAGVPASLGAFAGLETGRVTVVSTAQLDPLRMLPATTGSKPAVSANASFSLGGAATAQGGFSSNVGASFSLSDRLVFSSE